MSRMRDKGKVQKRSDYVKKVIANSQNTSKAVEKLSRKLFICERTIWRDLVR